MFAERSKTLKKMFLHAMQLQSITSGKTTESGVTVNTSAQQKDGLCSESPVVTSDESDDSILERVKKRKQSVRFAIDTPPDIKASTDNEQITKNSHDTDDSDIVVDEITETDEYETVEHITNTADIAIHKPINTDGDDTIETTNGGDTAVDQITGENDVSEQITDPNENEIEQVSDSSEGDAAVAQHGTESDTERYQSLPFNNRKYFESHIKPLKKKITCYVCEVRVLQRSLRWHMNHLHGYSFATLDDCLKVYKQRDKKFAHAELRKAANYVAHNICQVCKKPYSSKNNLKRHLKTVHKYKLTDLDKYFLKTRKYKLKKNTLGQQSSSTVGNSDSSNINSCPVCKLCRRKYKTTDNLFLHLRTFHKYTLKKLREYFNESTQSDKETKSDSQVVSSQSVAHIDMQIEPETEMNSQMSSTKTTSVDLAVGSSPPPLEGTSYNSCYKNKRRDPRVCKYCKEACKTKDLLYLHQHTGIVPSCPRKGTKSEQETEINSQISSHINTSVDQTVGGHHPSEATNHNSYNNKVEKRRVLCRFCKKTFTSTDLWQHIRNDFCMRDDFSKILNGSSVRRRRIAQIEEEIEQELEINNQMSSPETTSVDLAVVSSNLSSHIIAQTDDQIEQETEMCSQMSNRINTSDDQSVGGQHPSEETSHNTYKKVKKTEVVCTFCKKKYKSKKLLWKHIRNDLCKKNPTATKPKIGHKVSKRRIAQNEEKNEQRPETECNSQKSSPSVGQDKLSVAILTADGNQLNEEQAMKVKKLLQCKILTEAKDFASIASLPRFTTEPTFSDGVLKLQCKDDFTVKWLRNAVRNLHYYTEECPKLTLIRQCELNKVRMTLSLPDCDSSLDDAMLVLNRQNEWALVGTWTVLTHKMLSNGTLFLALAIPDDVFPLLEKENLQLFYNLGSVKLRLYNCYKPVTGKQSNMKHGRANKSTVVTMQPDTSTGE